MKPSNNVAKKIKVTIDDVNIFDAWCVEGESTEWLVPYFEKEEADRVAKIHACTYSPSKDAYEFTQDDVSEEFEGLMIDTAEGPKKVYSIGGGTWVWDKADDPSEKVEDANGDDIPEGCVLIAVEDVECGFTDGGRTPKVAHKKGEVGFRVTLTPNSPNCTLLLQQTLLEMVPKF